MSSVNKVIIVGHLGRDPDVRQLTNGNTVTNFSVATTRRWKDDTTGANKEETEWHNMVAYGRIGDVIGKFLKKGSLAYFEGRLKTRKYEAKDGTPKAATEIIVEQMQMLGGRDSSDSAPAEERQVTPPTKRGPHGGGPAYPPIPAAAPKPSSTATRASATAFDDMDSDIPF